MRGSISKFSDLGKKLKVAKEQENTRFSSFFYSKKITKIAEKQENTRFSCFFNSKITKIKPLRASTSRPPKVLFWLFCAFVFLQSLHITSCRLFPTTTMTITWSTSTTTSSTTATITTTTTLPLLLILLLRRHLLLQLLSHC